jgi:hypothetical protein
MKIHFNPARSLIAAAISILLVAFCWFLTHFVSLGTELARRMLVANSSSWLPSERLEVAAILDFASFFGGVWAAKNLWDWFHKQVRTSAGTKQSSNSLCDSSVALDVALAALPFSYYVVLSGVVLFARGRMPESTLVFLSYLVVGWLICTIAISALLVGTSRFWPAAWTDTRESDNSKLTKLDLQ